MVPRVSLNNAMAGLKKKEVIMKRLKTENLFFQENFQCQEVTKLSRKTRLNVLQPKTYSTNMRMKVYHCVVYEVPTPNTEVLLKSLLGTEDDINTPKKSCVEMMARELGNISSLQSAECLFSIVMLHRDLMPRAKKMFS
ncbi:unnamed protein product [Lepeophtheirus salmonis]|uniref:(salmon louse) hypothetical protein n=1 Tax=Lepeophtheirus salmonis TaxID=72036 RepID=A0A7R8HBB4_LEPSM|nr:unnamed protein product [Lepeophtheirus salmonis]CAF2970914.1 unnamed protein product [Lepeophtheirus salmonis]